MQKPNQSFESTHDSQQSFSLSIALTPKKTLLIGAGAVAWQKFKVLQDSQWEVCVWACEICDKRFVLYFVESNKNNLSLRGAQSEASATKQPMNHNVDYHENPFFKQNVSFMKFER